MRYAIIADIHSNLEALTAVLDDIEHRGGVDEIWCLGDIVGYGPDPCECLDDCITAYSVEDALDKCEEGKEVFIIGGGSVYRQFLDRADKMYITHVHKDFDADTFFPDINPEVWEVIDREDDNRADEVEFSWSYITYKRKK